MNDESYGVLESKHFPRASKAKHGGSEGVSAPPTASDTSLSHEWLHRLLKCLQSRKLTRTLADLDIITQDRHSFVANWTKLLDIGLRHKTISSVLDQTRMDQDRVPGYQVQIATQYEFYARYLLVLLKFLTIHC